MYETQKAQDIKEINNIKEQLRNFDDEHGFNRNDDNDDLDRWKIRKSLIFLFFRFYTDQTFAMDKYPNFFKMHKKC